MMVAPLPNLPLSDSAPSARAGVERRWDFTKEDPDGRQ